MPRSPYRVFISRVSSEFGQVSSDVASDLRARGLEIKFQDDFTQGGSAETWLQATHDFIRDCDAVICIAGLRSGGFPTAAAIQPHLPLVPQELSRISFTQWEFFFARHHRKKIFAYLAEPAWQPDKEVFAADDPESQQQFTRYLLHVLNQRSQPFDSPEDLQILVLRETWPDHSLSSSSLGPIHLPQPRLGDLFTGRDDDIENLSAAHFTRTYQPGNKPLVLHGPPGVGKTTLACELLYHLHDLGHLSHIYHVPAADPAALPTQLADLAAIVGAVSTAQGPVDPTTAQRELVKWARPARSRGKSPPLLRQRRHSRRSRRRHRGNQIPRPPPRPCHLATQ